MKAVLTVDPFIMAYDIGGTYIKFGVFNEAGQLIEQGKFDSIKGDGLFDCLVRHFKGFSHKYNLTGIGIGIPGIVKAGVVLTAVNLDLTEVPLRQDLERELGLPVAVVNDATLAAWGEKQVGTGPDPANFLLVTIGTGIGTGVVLEDQLREGHAGSFGELGHTVIEPNGRLCKCGNRGCLEQYVSIGGLLQNYTETFGKVSNIETLLGSNPPELAVVLDRSAEKLGLGLANAALLLDLRTILVGGGLAEIPGFIPKIRHWVNYYAMPAIKPVRVEKADLGNDAALYGAYHYLKAQAGKNPFKPRAR